ncbi:FHA domain-containing protein [bacterium]|nr:FHA domain-containing protein [bacterium]
MSSSVTTPTTSYLVVSSGSSSCDIYRLKSQRRVMIGRASQNRIVIPDPKCSRNHAEVVWLRGDWYVGDCGSQNGTTVNGQKIEGYYRLQPDDCIRIASYELRFAYDLVADVSADSSDISDLSHLSLFESPTRMMSDESTRLNLKKSGESSPPASSSVELIADDGASADGSIA